MLSALLPGDGIGPEVIAEAVRVLAAAGARDLVFETAEVGGAAYKASGHPLPQATLDVARRADAILFGAVGDPDCDRLERHQIGRASWRESVCQYVWISVVAVLLKKKTYIRRGSVYM